MTDLTRTGFGTPAGKSFVPEEELNVGNVVSGATPQTTQSANQGSQPKKKSVFESVGGTLSSIGKTLSENTEAAGMLARLGVAIGTSESDVQSVGARAGEAFLDQQSALEASKQQTTENLLASRAAGVAETRAGTEQDQLQFDMDVFDQLGDLKAKFITAQTTEALARSNAALKNANTNALNTQINDVRNQLAQGKQDVNTQLSAFRLVHQIATNVASREINPTIREQLYQDEFLRLTNDLKITGAVPFQSIIGPSINQNARENLLFNQENIQQLLQEQRSTDTQTGTPTTIQPTVGSTFQEQGETTDELVGDVGAVVAGIFPGGEAESIQRKERKAQQVAKETTLKKYEGRIKTTTVKEPTGAGGRLTTVSVETEPEGTGTTIQDPFLLTTGSEKHMELIKGLTKGTYFDLDGILHQVIGPQSYIKVKVTD